VTKYCIPVTSRGWLRHYATSWKGLGSIPDVIGFFNGLILLGSLWPWGSTQRLIEMSTRNLSGCKGRPTRKPDNFTAICEPIVYKMWEPRRLTTLWAFRACYRDSVTFFMWNSKQTAFFNHIHGKQESQPTKYTSGKAKTTGTYIVRPPHTRQHSEK
jgi:hypothetical protein